MKTTLLKEADVKPSWYLVDATDQPVGRLAVKLANLVRGKNSPAYTPHVDMGNFVVVINAEKVRLTGSKEQKKVYERYSGFPGGLRARTAAQVRAKDPGFLIYHAVKSMLPKNKLSRRLFTHLKVYVGTEHPHAAQKPQALAW